MSSQDFIKLDEIRSKHRIILTGAVDEAKFGRVYNRSLLRTHRLTFTELVVPDGELKRKAIDIELTPFDLPEIRARSNDFAELSQLELNELIRRYGIELPSVHGRPDPAADKLAMIESLRAYKPPKVEKPKDDKAAMIIPADIDALNTADLHTKAATLGVSIKAFGGKTADDSTIKQRIVKKLSGKPASE